MYFISIDGHYLYLILCKEGLSLIQDSGDPERRQTNQRWKVVCRGGQSIIHLTDRGS